MLVVLMVVCAGIAVLLIAVGAFGELRDLWEHPDHRISEEDSRGEKPRPDRLLNSSDEPRHRSVH